MSKRGECPVRQHQLRYRLLQKDLFVARVVIPVLTWTHRRQLKRQRIENAQFVIPAKAGTQGKVEKKDRLVTPILDKEENMIG